MELKQNLVKDLILWHHKISSYEGEDADLVDVFRRADWIDGSMNFRKMGAPMNFIRNINNKFPNEVFYDTLKRLGPELSDGNIFKMFKSFSRVYKI